MLKLYRDVIDFTRLIQYYQRDLSKLTRWRLGAISVTYMYKVSVIAHYPGKIPLWCLLYSL